MKRIVNINGDRVDAAAGATLVETEPGVYAVLSGDAVYEVRVEGDEIAIGKYRFRYEIEDPREWKRSGRSADVQGRLSITAPMPGKVVRVLAAVGDQVIAGQGLIVVEAMKMQNEMKAPRDGRVSAIEVKENDSVNAGAVLVTIE